MNIDQLLREIQITLGELRETEQDLREALTTDLPMSPWTDSRLQRALNRTKRMIQATTQLVKRPL